MLTNHLVLSHHKLKNLRRIRKQDVFQYDKILYICLKGCLKYFLIKNYAIIRLWHNDFHFIVLMLCSTFFRINHDHCEVIHKYL